MMSVRPELSSKSSDIVDLVSDEEDDHNQFNHEQLQNFYELASLRSLIPPNFSLCSPEDDFDFFSEELALSLLNASWRSLFDYKKSNPQAAAQNTCVTTTPAVNSVKPTIENASTRSTNSNLSLESSKASFRSFKNTPVTTSAPTSSFANASNRKVNKVKPNSTKGSLPSLSNSECSKTPTLLTASSLASISPEKSVPKVPRPIYDCTKCNQKFNYSVALLDHLANVHKLSEDSVNSMSKHPSLNKISSKSSSVERKTKDKVKSSKTDSLTSKKQKETETRKRKRRSKEPKRVHSTTVDVIIPKSLTEDQPSLVPETISSTPISVDVLPSFPMLERIKVSSSPPPVSDSPSDDVRSSENLVIDESAGTDSDAGIDNSLSNPVSDASDSGISDVDEFMKSFTFLTVMEVETKAGMKYRCSVCNKYFSSMELAVDHYDKCSNRKYLSCSFPNCSKSNFSPAQFKIHLKVKHNILTYSCKVCKSYFAQTQKLKTHRLYCVNREYAQYHCPAEGCQMTFFYELHFRKHLSRRHNIRSSFLCKVCKLFFHEEEDLNEHVKTDVHISANEEREHWLAMVEEQKKAEKLLTEKKKLERSN